MPWLVLMRGLPGSGKSALSRALSLRMDWPLIDKDDVKDVIDLRAPDSGRLAYEVMLRIARRQLLQDSSVICDSPLTFGWVYDLARSIAAETGANIAIVECSCAEEELMRSRILARQSLALPAHHVATWDDFEAARRRMLPEMAYAVLDPHVIVETAHRQTDDLAAEVEQWLMSLEA
jgi:predicted kinase